MLLMAKAAIGPAPPTRPDAKGPWAEGLAQSAQVGGTDLLCSRDQKVLGTGWPRWTTRAQPVQDAPPHPCPLHRPQGAWGAEGLTVKHQDGSDTWGQLSPGLVWVERPRGAATLPPTPLR